MSLTNSIRGTENNLNDIHYNNENNISYSDSPSNLYEILFKLREENNSLLIRLRDFENIKKEFVFLKNNFIEIEKNNQSLHEENQKLISKIEEYQNLNKNWEIKVKEINSLLQRMEQKNLLLNEENEKISKEFDDLEMKFRISLEKEKYSHGRLKNFENCEIEYEQTLDEFKNKKKSWIEKENFYLNEIKNLENNISQSENKIGELLIENKKSDEKLIKIEKFFEKKEKEFCDMISKKDKFMKDLQKSIHELKFEYESRIMQLNDNLENMMIDNKENEDNEKRIKIFYSELREKDEIIKEMQFEIEKYRKIKKNCYLLANEIKFK